MGILLLLLSLAGLVVSFIVIIEAFKDEWWKGLLALFVPIYWIIYAVNDFEHDYKWWFITIWVACWALNVYLRFAHAAS